MSMRKRPPRIQLIACDIDHTLMPFGAEKVSDENVDAINAAREAGIAVILATGRHYMTAMKRVHELGMQDVPVIASNGTDIRLGDKSVHTVDLDDDTVDELARDIESYGLPLYLFCDDEILCVRKDERPSLFAAWTAEADGRNPVRMLETTAELLQAARGRTQKVLSDVGEDLKDGTGDAELHARILSELQHKYGTRADVACGGGLNIEINAKGVSKADGLRCVCDMLDIPMEETMAIGDSGNDAQMLRAAALGVAVGNAMPPALEAADVVTASCEENGVAQAIRDYALQQVAV